MSKTLSEKLCHSREYQQERLLLRVTEEIIRIAEKEGISYRELAKRSGTGPSYVSVLLRGEQGMTLSKVASLFHAMGYSLNITAVPLCP